MSSLDLKPKESCAYDILSLGEIMLRLDPGEGRIRTTRQFRCWEGGGEYNVARGLRRCFGQRAAVVTAFATERIRRFVKEEVLAVMPMAATTSPNESRMGAARQRTPSLYSSSSTA